MGGVADGYTDNRRQSMGRVGERYTDEEEEALLAYLLQLSLQRGYSNLEPVTLSDDIDEDQAILSAMEAEMIGPADAGIDMDEVLHRVADPRNELRQQRFQEAGESA
jgi:hypothetical protein